MIGVLDIQGSVEEHLDALMRAGVDGMRVRTVEDLAELDGLIIPGGESTTITMLLGEIGEEIKRKKLPAWGTCAGAIIMKAMGLIDIEVERNAYGGQLNSFESEVKFEGKKVPGIFIRAPKIFVKGEDVPYSIQGKMMVTVFHPELTDDLTVLKKFIKLASRKG